MAWSIKTAYWDSSGAGVHSSLTTEPWFLTFQMQHQFNRPALAIVILNDRAGQATQKYEVDAGSDLAYLVSGRIQILEDATVVFDGRIMSGHTDHASGTYRLVCKDWLSQLEDELIHFDTRGDLDASGTRERTAHGDVLATNNHCVWTSGTDYYFVDDVGGWTTNEWDGFRLIFPHKMAGQNEYWQGPYDETVLPAADTDSPTNGEQNVWDCDGSWHVINDDDSGFTVEYYFHSPRRSALYNSIQGVRLEIDGYAASNQTGGCLIEIYDYNASGYESIGFLPETISEKVHVEINIPEYYWGRIFHSTSGNVAVRITVVDKSPASTGVNIDMIRLYYKVTMNGDDGAYEILSNTNDTLKVDTDLTDTVVGIWEGCPYSICDSVVTHATTLVQGYDPLVPLTISTGTPTHFYVARHFSEMKPIKILSELAKTTGAVFYADPSDWDSIKWVSTWTPSSPPSLTDGDVLEWETQRDAQTFYNEYHVYGIRLPDEQVYVNTEDLTVDPGADSKSLFGLTKAKVLMNPAIYSVQDAEEVGSKLVERDEDIQFILTATLPGLSTHRLGDDIAVTSTYLGLSSANYWVIDFQFDLAKYETKLTLHPDTTQDQFKDALLVSEFLRKAVETGEEADRKTYAAPVWKDVWT